MNNTVIKYFNRKKNKIEEELIYGDTFVRLAYESPIRKILSPFISTRPLSTFYGALQNMSISKNKVPPFVKKFSINMDDYKGGSLKTQKKEDSFKNFNEFFIRTFEEGKREFITDSHKLAAFSEARYFGIESVNEKSKFPVKGKYLSAKELVNNEELAHKFMGGPLLIARLCPVDYHRYHYPDDGETLTSFSIHGDYHSVNPIALKTKPDIFIKNERRVSHLKTKNFGELLYVEVGATCVGRIVQTFDEKRSFNRGDEKGYFLFGGSTVIVLGEKGSWSPSSDILKNTSEGLETYLTLGDEVAYKL